MKVGDYVLKNGHHEKGEKGVVLEIKKNSLNNIFLKILKSDGTISTWYMPLVEVIKNNEE